MARKLYRIALGGCTSALEGALRISAGSTDLEGWRSVASKDVKECWRDRAQLAAAFLRPGDIVCDLGAGAQPLRSFLPEGALYIAVDCVDTLPGTHLADFNAPDFTLPHWISTCSPRGVELAEGRGSFCRASLPACRGQVLHFYLRSLGRAAGAWFARRVHGGFLPICKKSRAGHRLAETRLFHREIRARRNKWRFQDARNEHIFEISAASGILGAKASEAENDATMACLTKAAFPGKRAIRWLMGVEHLKREARARTFA